MASLRFYDHIMRDKRVSPEIKSLLDGITVISCDTVGRLYWQESDQENWDFKDFPNIAPPFPAFWLDFSAPSQITSEEFGITSWAGPDYYGFLCYGIDLSRGQDVQDAFLATQIWTKTADYFRTRLSQARWGVDCYLSWRYQGTLTLPLWGWRFLVDDQGQVLTEGPGKDVIATGPLSTEYIEMLEHMSRRVGSYEQARLTIYSVIVPYFHTAMLSLSFLHCKNISLVEVNPLYKPVYNKAQKRRGETGYQPIPYKVLTIEPMKQVLRTEGRSGEVGTQKALHICRGNFAHYQEGRGLFGKYTGTYWRPMHVRGSSTKGVATKDYQIKL